MVDDDFVIIDNKSYNYGKYIPQEFKDDPIFRKQFREGFMIGFEQGEEKAKLKTINKLLSKGLSAEEVSTLLDVPTEDVQKYSELLHSSDFKHPDRKWRFANPQAYTSYVRNSQTDTDAFGVLKAESIELRGKLAS